LSPPFIAPVRGFRLVVGRRPPGPVIPAATAVPIGEPEEAPRPIGLGGRWPSIRIVGPGIIGPARAGEPQGDAAPQTRSREFVHGQLLCKAPSERWYPRAIMAAAQ
jgi:hypothetical protein